MKSEKHVTEDVRWKQRLASFEKAMRLLREPFARDLSSLSALEHEGVAQRFEFAFELAWKTLKDYLESEGQRIEPLTPKQVIKVAFNVHVIEDGQVWIDMLTHRNKLAHTYDESNLKSALGEVRDRYLQALQSALTWLTERSSS